MKLFRKIKGKEAHKAVIILLLLPADAERLDKARGNTLKGEI